MAMVSIYCTKSNSTNYNVCGSWWFVAYYIIVLGLSSLEYNTDMSLCHYVNFNIKIFTVQTCIMDKLQALISNKKQYNIIHFFSLRPL